MVVYLCYDLKAPQGAQAVEIYTDSLFTNVVYTCTYQTVRERVIAACRAQNYCKQLNWMITEFLDGSSRVALGLEPEYQLEKRCQVLGVAKSKPHFQNRIKI